jgi:hypothetical protein
MSEIKRDIDLANVRLNKIEQEDDASFIALNKTIDVLGDIYELYRTSDPPKEHLITSPFSKRSL